MIIESLSIPDVKVIHPSKHEDERGFFSETFARRDLAEAGLDIEFVQDNHVLSAQEGTVRGLHFQIKPFAQGKLVRVVRGAILDVALDIRVGSPTYGQHVAAKISADSWNQVFIPIGFAHGLATLEPNTEVLYKVTNYYSPEHDKGVLWNDPHLSIDWPVTERDAVLSPRDREHPVLSVLPEYFQYSAKASA